MPLGPPCRAKTGALLLEALGGLMGEPRSLLALSIFLPESKVHGFSSSCFRHCLDPLCIVLNWVGKEQGSLTGDRHV